MTNFEEKNRLNKEDFVEKDDYCKQLGGKQMGIESITLGVQCIPRIPYIRQSVFS